MTARAMSVLGHGCCAGEAGRGAGGDGDRGCDRALVEQRARAGGGDPDAEMRGRGRAGRAGWEIDVAGRADAVAGPREAARAGDTVQAHARIARIDDLARGLRSGLAGIGAVQRKKKLASGGGATHAGCVTQIGDVGIDEKEVEQRRLESISLGHGGILRKCRSRYRLATDWGAVR